MKKIVAFLVMIFAGGFAQAQTISVSTDFVGVSVPDPIVIDDDDVTTIPSTISMAALRELIRDDVETEVDAFVAMYEDIAGAPIPANKIGLFLIQKHNQKLDEEAKNFIWHNRIIDAWRRLRRELTENRKQRIRIVN